MRTLAPILTAVAIVFAFATAPEANAQRPGDLVPGRYVVEVVNGADAVAVAGSHGVAPDRVFGRAVNGFAGFVPPGRLRALANDPAVLAISPDRVVGIVVKPDKPGGGGGKPSGGSGGGQVVPAGVARIGADPAASTLTGAGVGVAIVDTGVDLDNPDLNVAPENYSTQSFSGDDDNGHGTHVAGTVAALDNDIDVVGVAPGATIYAVKVLSASGSGYDSDIIEGLDWVATNAGSVTPNIRVVNMSLGRPGSLNDNPTLRAAVAALHDAGIAVVVAAGNDYDMEVSEQVPATYPEVLAVASTTAQKGTSKLNSFPQGISADTASYFTTDGAFDPATGIGVTVSAPGEEKEDVSRAGFISSVGILSLKRGGGTTRMSGTSMASPHVAGVVARIVDLDPGLDVEAIRDLIRANADNVGAAPLDSPTSVYTFDGEHEGVVRVPDLY